MADAKSSIRPTPPPIRQALWHMRWPGLFLCGPLVGLVLVAMLFGLPDTLWLLAGGFFIFSLALFGLLVRGEYQQLRQATRNR